MKIAIAGTHGTAKSTLANKQFESIKSEYPDLSVGILTEVVRDCPLPINKNATSEAQLWMFTTQLQREIEMESEHDIIVCDRSLVDYVAYTKFIDINWATGMLEMVKKWAPTYHNIFVPSLEKYDFLEEDGVRDIKNTQWRKEIQSEIIYILTEFTNSGILEDDQFYIIGEDYD